MMCNYANTKNYMTTLETSQFMRLVKISSSFVSVRLYLQFSVGQLFISCYILLPDSNSYGSDY